MATPMHRKLRHVSKRNKFIQLVVQVQYHVNVIYSLGGRHTRTHARTHKQTYQRRGQKQFQETKRVLAEGWRVPGLKAYKI